MLLACPTIGIKFSFLQYVESSHAICIEIVLETWSTPGLRRREKGKERARKSIMLTRKYLLVTKSHVPRCGSHVVKTKRDACKERKSAREEGGSKNGDHDESKHITL